MTIPPNGATRWWHGGAPGLEVGGWILPPAVTGVPNNEDVIEMVAGQRDLQRVTRKDRVYITPEFRYALHHAKAYVPFRTYREWAERQGRTFVATGWVYEVEPEGPLYFDSDCPPELSAACARARIVGVVVPTKAQYRSVGRDRSRWDRMHGGAYAGDPVLAALEQKLATRKRRPRRSR
jgi:hypothetical protein